MGVAHLMTCALIRINKLTFTRAFWNAYAVMEGVTLDTFIDFLTLCESNGFIELKLSVEELREQLQSILDNANRSTQCDNTPALSTNSDKRRSSLNEYPGSHGNSFDIHFSDIQTPELISTPLSYREQNSTSHLDCEPMGVNVDVDSGIQNGTTDSFQEDRLSPHLENKLNFDDTPSKSSLDIHFSGIETPEIISTPDDEHSNSITDCTDLHKDETDHTDLHNSATDHTGLHESATDLTDLHNSATDLTDSHESSDDDDADDQLEKLFSDMKLKSASKSATKHISSRKSLSVFVVSDSEDVEVISSDDEENLPPISFASPSGPKPPSSSYQTPCTPSSGIMFWGSPTTENVKAQTTMSKKHKRPLGVSNYYDSPSDWSVRTPVGKPTRPPPSLTTPSANKNFSRFKTVMIDELYSHFNRTVFDNKLPVDMKIIWNKKLRTTAGYCCYLGALGARSARIELSNKVVDSYDRIRDTLVHEMCHAATWIIDGIKGGGHGREWRAWAYKANEVYPDLKPITRCHSYAIQYKYTYKCTTCDFTNGRHSKSVNLARARCPHCLSTLELLPRLKVDGTPAAERKLNRYAQFVKDHYGEIKSGSPWRSHTEIMDKLKDLYHQKPTINNY